MYCVTFYSISLSFLGQHWNGCFVAFVPGHLKKSAVLFNVHTRRSLTRSICTVRQHAAGIVLKDESIFPHHIR